jgi:hypothetical protein
MPDQLALFDLPTAPAAPGRAPKARATKDTAPAPRAAQVPRVASQGAQGAARFATAAEHEARLASLRAHYAELCAATPGQPLDATTVASLTRLGIAYLGSYAACEESLHVLEATFTVAGGRTILTKTGPGIAALIEALDLPDDLLAASVRRYGPDHAYLTLADGGSVRVSFAFPTLERNVESARAYLAAAERTRASEAERAAKAGKKRGRRK